MDEIERLKVLVKKLKSNDENVPRQELETKYEKPYKKLKQDIKELAEKILYSLLFDSLFIFRDDEGYELVEEIRNFADEENKNGMGKRLGKILVSEYDVNKFIDDVLLYRKKIWGIYEPYYRKNEEALDHAEE